jgi:hypothetical protein
MDGKIFSVEIAPGSFSEYLASNISPCNYSFYSENDPNLKGELTIVINYFTKTFLLKHLLLFDKSKD